MSEWVYVWVNIRMCALCMCVFVNEWVHVWEKVCMYVCVTKGHSTFKTIFFYTTFSFVCPCKSTSNKRPPLLWDLVCLISRVVLKAGSLCIALNPDTFRQNRILNDNSGCFIHYALLRILYGKMLSKAGNETAGRRRADVRRSIVFRFLAGCTPAEMKIFLGLVFGPFNQFVTGSKYIFRGGECKQFIFCCFWFSFLLEGWMQTIHFLLEDRKFKQIHSRFVPTWLLLCLGVASFHSHLDTRK